MKTFLLLTALVVCIILAPHVGGADTLSIQPALALPDYTKLNLGTNENSAFRAFYGIMEIGDFNEDGRKDAAVMLLGNAQGFFPLGLSIQLQNADGSITRKAEYTLPNINPAWEFVVADYNEDSHLDIIVSDIGHDLVMLFGHGDGTFQEPTFMGLSASGFPVAADMDGDGHLDLVVGTQLGVVAVFAGWGDGTFAWRTTLYSSINAHESRYGQIMVGDLNQDGKLDVAVAAATSDAGSYGSLEIFLGNGDATFREVVRTPDVAVWKGALGDFNGDGFLDYAGNRYEPEQLEIWQGQGDGRFTRSQVHPLSGERPDIVQVADLNHDGIQDVVVSGETSDTVFVAPLSIFLGKGDSTFRPSQLWTPLDDFYVYNVGPRLADFNGDGLLDIVSVPRHGVGDLTVVGPRVFAVALNRGLKPSLDAGFMLTVRNDETSALGSVVLESSANLTDWTPLTTNSSVTTWPFVDADAAAQSQRSYRTRRQESITAPFRP